MSLTTEQRWFLQALEQFLHPGGAPGPEAAALPGPDALNVVWALSRAHKVLPLTYDAAARLPAGDAAVEALRARWKQQVLRAVYTQTIQSQAFLGLCTAFREAGLKVLVVKGILCRSLYPKPDCRTSADEDLYVSPGQFPAVHSLLLARGLTVADPAGDAVETAQVVTYADGRTGLRLELHRQLFSPDSGAYGKVNVVFSSAMERAVEMSVDGVPVWSMCPTDHMLYLIFHAYKHFLHSGFGIRQVCDICLYAQAFSARIDWGAVYQTLRAHRADVFAAALWTIGRDYLGFARADYLPAEVPPVEDLLLDILAGGVYGSSSEDRRHSSLITLNAAAGQSRGGSLLRTVFPGADALRGKYAYLNGRPWLLPAAWAQRIASYLSKGGRVSASESVRIGTQRVALLNKYGITQEP